MSKTKVIILILVGILTICALSGGIVAAKYIDGRNSDALVRTKEFYFTSNILDGKEHTLAPGSTSFSFTVGNHEDDLRYSNVDINYTVTVECTTTVENTATVTPATGTLANDKVNDAKITISGLQPGKTYTVKTIGTGGYTKTLTATIVVPVAQSKLYYYVDDSAAAYILVTVWNEGDASGNAAISYTGIPDNTNPNMGDWQTNGEQTVEIPAHGSKVYRFFGEKGVRTVTVSGAESKILH